MVKITKNEIDLDEIDASVADKSAGGVAIFVGRVRDTAEGREIVRMAYEAYESMALREMEKIAQAARKTWPVKKLALVHRIGMLELGEASVAIAVACEHRAEAFDACRYIIDTLKQTVPIWKKEFGPGGAAWVEGVIPQSKKYVEEKPE